MAKYKEYQAEVRRKRMIRWVIVLFLIVLITCATVGLAYVASRMLTGKPLFDENPQTDIATGLGTSSSSQADDTADGEALPGGDDGSATTLPRYWNTLMPVAQTVSNATIAADSRMLALPANGRVDYEYFRTALFVGDSLTQGFGIYPPLKDIAMVAGFKGIGPREILQNAVAELQTYEKVAAWDYICQQTPLNIYVGIGTNALISLPEDAAFLKYYGDFLDALRAQFPSIPIYVQSITPVTQVTNDNRPLMANDRIRGLNNAIAVLAMEKGMYYLNLHEVLADENGCLRADIASTKDGTHMRDKMGYEIWVDYLSTHTAYSPNNLQYVTEPYTS